MNTLYVWFPASWGPSVVEAISKRNQRWLQQHPVHRDPTMFNPLEVQNGTASRDMRYKIQKWNVNSEKVHPILVANARVDWMSLEDSDITQQFEILREGILRDVFSQRTSSAWQGMRRKGSQCRSCCLVWAVRLMNGWTSCSVNGNSGTMTTRHASLAPIEMLTFQRERRLMQSKHLWDTFSIDWYKLDSKLCCSKPTGLGNSYGRTSLSRSTAKIRFRRGSIRGMMQGMCTTSGTLISATCMHTSPPKLCVVLIWTLL